MMLLLLLLFLMLILIIVITIYSCCHCDHNCNGHRYQYQQPLLLLLLLSTLLLKSSLSLSKSHTAQRRACAQLQRLLTSKTNCHERETAILRIKTADCRRNHTFTFTCKVQSYPELLNSRPETKPNRSNQIADILPCILRLLLFCQPARRPPTHLLLTMSN